MRSLGRETAELLRENMSRYDTAEKRFQHHEAAQVHVQQIAAPQGTVDLMRHQLKTTCTLLRRFGDSCDDLEIRSTE